MSRLTKFRDITVTVLLGIMLIFFVVIGIFQLYANDGIKQTDERIVLGVGTTTSPAFGTAMKGRPAPMEDSVGIVTGGSFTIVDENAKILTTENFMLSDPIVHARGKYCAVADYGGNNVRLYNNKGDVECELEAEGNVISVVTNTNGFFAVATEETGYTVINVYHKNGEPIYRYRISGNVFVDMDISANNRRLVVAEARLGEGVAGSNVIMVEFNRVDAEREIYVESNMYVNVHFNKDGSFVCLGNKGVDFYRADCAKLESISFDGRIPEKADIMTDDFVALCFAGATDANGGEATLEIYDKKGKMRGSVVFEQEIRSISVNGAYAAVSYGEKVDIVKPNGKIKKTLEAEATVKSAVPFANGGSALVFAGGNTKVIK